jgi:hypothetical protein
VQGVAAEFDLAVADEPGYALQRQPQRHEEHPPAHHQEGQQRTATLHAAVDEELIADEPEPKRHEAGAEQTPDESPQPEQGDWSPAPAGEAISHAVAQLGDGHIRRKEVVHGRSPVPGASIAIVARAERPLMKERRSLAAASGTA